MNHLRICWETLNKQLNKNRFRSAEDALGLYFINNHLEAVLCFLQTPHKIERHNLNKCIPSLYITCLVIYHKAAAYIRVNGNTQCRYSYFTSDEPKT